MHPLTVIFDMDGVILDTERTTKESWMKAAQDLSMDTSAVKDAAIACIGMNEALTKTYFIEAFSHLKDFDYDRLRELEQIYFAQASENGTRLPVMDGARELLEFLSQNGAVTALASSTRLSKIKNELSAAGLLSYFQEVVSGDMVSHGKPDPEIYLLCAKRLGIAPQQAYVIEDSYNGIRSAHAAGTMPIMVPDYLPPTEEMKQLSVRILPSLYAVRKFFQKKTGSPL